MLRKGQSAVKTALQNLPKNATEAPDSILFRLSEERGINPDMVMAISNDLGWGNLSVRVGFSADMADRNARMTKDAAKIRDKNNFLKEVFPVTSQDYYLDTNKTHFTAEVLHCGEINHESNNITGLASPASQVNLITSSTSLYASGASSERTLGVFV